MLKKVNLSPLTKLDLLDIVTHIALENQRASDEFTGELITMFSLLLTQPEMGRKRPELGDRLRSFPIKNHVILYEPTQDGILVVRVLHGARDIENIIDR